MKKNINVEVNSIRLEENTETPIMLLLDPNSQKVLPIWIGTIEAVSIAYAQEGIKHPRPQTHDLIIDIIESLNGNMMKLLSQIFMTTLILQKSSSLEIKVEFLYLQDQVTL